MSYGFVYILSNPAMPGFYKIGMTERPPQQRVDELSKSTSVPFAFQIVCYGEVSDALQVEQELHKEFAQYRANYAREFFKFDRRRIEDCIFSLQEWAINFCQGIHEEHLEYLVSEEILNKKVGYFLSQCAEPIVFAKKMEFDDEELI